MTNTHPIPDDATIRPASSRHGRIGEMMLARGLITEEQLEIALEHQRHTGKKMGEILVEIGALSRLDLTKVLAERLGYPFIDLRTRTFDPAITALVPEEVARRYGALPVELDDGQLVVAMTRPDDVFALDDLRVLTEMPVAPVMADREQLAEAMSRCYAGSNVVSIAADDAAEDYDEEASELARVATEAEDAPIVRLVNAMLEQAATERASDIHVEPLSDRVRIRFRTDGVLHEVSEVPISLLRPLISRLKVLSGIDIATRRVPQDGRFSVSMSGSTLDIRVATLPTGHGEAAVLRLLDTVRGPLDLRDLGLVGDELERYEWAYYAPQGCILVSGPTGSGKTSTLYGTLLELNTPERSIVSIEDPIEYQIDGTKQIQVNPRAGLTFASALRAILRSDPDVVMVGEIRDTETAKLATEASITGHLVLSTLHTTRAAAVPMRLIDMGVEPYLVASALTCVVAQRLVRRVCDECAATDEGDVSLLRRLGCGDEELHDATVRRAVGCPACSNTGYRGRIGIYEVMTMTEEIGRLVLARASTQEIERRALADGMNTLQLNAVRQVLAGQLTIDEMMRVIA